MNRLNKLFLYHILQTETIELNYLIYIFSSTNLNYVCRKISVSRLIKTNTISLTALFFKYIVYVFF